MSKPSDSSLPPFLISLVRMVDAGDCIQWTSNGQAFLISNVEDFCARILPMYFKHNKLPSFVRQLNMYKFAKFGPAATHQWTHDSFIKGHPEKLAEIKRKSGDVKSKDDLGDAASVLMSLPRASLKEFPILTVVPDRISTMETSQSYKELKEEIMRLSASQKEQQRHISELELQKSQMQKELEEGKKVQQAMKAELNRSVQNVTAMLGVVLSKQGADAIKLLDFGMEPFATQLSPVAPSLPELLPHSTHESSGNNRLASAAVKKRHLSTTGLEFPTELPPQVRKLN